MCNSYSEGFGDSYQSTGTLNRILQGADTEDHDDSSECDDEGDVNMKNNSDKQDGTTNKSPKLETILADDDFLAELRIKNEHLLK